MRSNLLIFVLSVFCTNDYNAAHPTRTITPLSTNTNFDSENTAAANSPFTSAIDIIENTSASTNTIVITAQDDLDDFSVQDILSLDIDANDKIDKKIKNAITEFISKLYAPVHVGWGYSFQFPKDSINIDFAMGNATFYNFNIEEESDTLRKHSTSMGCDSSRKAKVEVTIPKNIKVTANVNVTNTVDSSNGLFLKPISEGSITIIFKLNSISEQFSIQDADRMGNEKDETTKKFSYFGTEMHLDIDTKYQKNIHNNLELIFNEVESWLAKFYVDKLGSTLAEKGISMGRSCTKFYNVERNSKILGFPVDFNNLYVLSSVTLDTWKGVRLSMGPIVFGGLSHFNSTEFTISEIEEPSIDYRDGYYYNPPTPDDQGSEEKRIRIKTNGLKGKLD